MSEPVKSKEKPTLLGVKGLPSTLTPGEPASRRELLIQLLHPLFDCVSGLGWRQKLLVKLNSSGPMSPGFQAFGVRATARVDLFTVHKKFLFKLASRHAHLCCVDAENLRKLIRLNLTSAGNNLEQ